MLWAAVSKLANPTDFLASLYAYELPLPRDWIKIVAVVLPWTELLCGLLLLGRQWMETALLVTTALFAVFVLATGQAWARGLDISCGCFDMSILGLTAENSRIVHFLESVGFAFFRNIALGIAAGFLLRRELLRAPAGIDTGASVLASAPRSRPEAHQGRRRRR
jgi:hypothetical protein